MRLLIPPPLQELIAFAMIWSIGPLTPEFAISFVSQKIEAISLSVTELMIVGSTRLLNTYGTNEFDTSQ